MREVRTPRPGFAQCPNLHRAVAMPIAGGAKREPWRRARRAELTDEETAPSVCLERQAKTLLILPEDKQQHSVDSDHHRCTGKVALAVMVEGAEPPTETSAQFRHDQAEQDDARSIVDEEEQPIGQVKQADENWLLQPIVEQENK